MGRQGCLPHVAVVGLTSHNSLVCRIHIKRVHKVKIGVVADAIEHWTIRLHLLKASFFITGMDFLLQSGVFGKFLLQNRRMVEKLLRNQACVSCLLAVSIP